MDRTLEVNFCFDLVRIADMKVQRSSTVFTYMGAYMYKRIRCSFLRSVSAFLTNSLLSFHVILFFSVLLLFLFPYAMGRPESWMLSVNRICLLHGDFKSFSSSLR
jgi:hypothetical protein